MTNQELRDLYGCLKSRADNADTLPSFAAVQRAKKEGRIIAEQGIEDGSLRKSVLLFAKAKQKVTVLFTDRGMNKTHTFPPRLSVSMQVHGSGVS